MYDVFLFCKKIGDLVYKILERRQAASENNTVLDTVINTINGITISDFLNRVYCRIASIYSTFGTISLISVYFWGHKGGNWNISLQRCVN